MFPVLYGRGHILIFTYHVIVVIGAILSFAFLFSRRENMGLKTEGDFWLLLNVILIGSYLGARLLYLLEYTSISGRAFLIALLFPFEGGTSMLGGVFAVILGTYLFCRSLRIEALRLWDYLGQVAPFWHFFGRLGCFAAGCCWGRAPGEHLPWAVTFTDSRSSLPQELLGKPLHPAQLYEAFADLALAALLYRFVLIRIESGRLKPGTLAAAYLASYGIIRFITEYFRGDGIPIPALGITVAQGIGIGLLTLAATLLATLYRKPRAA